MKNTTITQSASTLANPNKMPRVPKKPAPPSLAAYATYGEKHRATEILAKIVATSASDTEAFAALDEAFELIEGIRRRVGR